jgi:hypothetical protein
MRKKLLQKLLKKIKEFYFEWPVLSSIEKALRNLDKIPFQNTLATFRKESANLSGER